MSSAASRPRTAVPAADVRADDVSGPVPSAAHPWVAAPVLEQLQRQCLAALRAAPEAGLDASESGRLTRRVREQQALAILVDEHSATAMQRRLADCEDGLSRLRASPSSAALLDQACDVLVQQCGFGRALLSRVEGANWYPWRWRSASPDGPGTWAAEGRGDRQALNAVSGEARAIADGTPVVVHARDHADRHHPMRDAGADGSYIVVPLQHRDEVIGLIHVDHGASGRPIEQFDHDLVWRFARSLCHIHESATLAERLEDQRERVREALVATRRMMDEVSTASIGLDVSTDAPAWFGPRAAAPAVPSPVDSGLPLDRLTKRERDVLELMVTGAGNHAIADRLVIAPGTVKFHVQNIFRKLGAANRAQLIAACLRGPEPAAD